MKVEEALGVVTFEEPSLLREAIQSSMQDEEVQRENDRAYLPYIVALLSLIGGFGLRILFDPFLHGMAPFVFFYLAVAVSCWYGGLIPGILTILGGYFLSLMIIVPYLAIDLKPSQLGSAVVLYLIICSIFVFLTESLRRARRVAEEHARESKRQSSLLEQRVIERTLALEMTNQELESFSYSVSHDLRAPLRSVLASASMLVEDYGDKLDSEGKAHIERLQGSAKNMAMLIDDILKLSRLSRGEMERQEIDLSALAQSAVDEAKQHGGHDQVQFIIHPEVHAFADERLVKALLVNLFDNAAKFSSKSESPIVEFGFERGAYYVQDNGIGIDPKYAEQIFHAFERLHRPNEYPGTGIGLATVQRIVSRHTGRVWVESEEGKGARFWFTLGE